MGCDFGGMCRFRVGFFLGVGRWALGVVFKRSMQCAVWRACKLCFNFHLCGTCQIVCSYILAIEHQYLDFINAYFYFYSVSFLVMVWCFITRLFLEVLIKLPYTVPLPSCRFHDMSTPRNCTVVAVGSCVRTWIWLFAWGCCCLYGIWLTLVQVQVSF